MIYRNHFELRRSDYQDGLLSGLYNVTSGALSIEPVIDNKYEVFMGCINLVDPKLQWDMQEKIRDKGVVREKLESPQTRLSLLFDQRKSVGFTVVKPVDDTTRQKYFDVFEDNPIEIDYFALYEGEEGKGRGKSFLKMLFADLFRDYDPVYLSQHSTNAPTLERFYREKMGMTLLEKEGIPDFRVL